MSETIQRDPEQDGIVLELARDDVARKKFLKMAGRSMGSAAAATGLAAFVAACGSSSKKTTTSTPAASTGSGSTGNTGTSTSASMGSGDLAIVNYALTLEYLESQFYAKVVAAKLFTGAMGSTVKTFGEEEDAHVAALKKVAMSLGTPVTEPTGKFPITTAASVATLAAKVENLGAAAYLGAAPMIKSAEILAAALSIHSVEARHAATLNYATKQNPTPQGAFATGMSMTQVEAAVKPFIA